MVSQDTIVALATPEGQAGLAVVRLSGPEALAIADRVFSARGWSAQPTSHLAVYGILKHPSSCKDNGCDHNSSSQREIDQVLALPLLSPRSYTGEDTVEFFCHGGRIVSRLVVAACRAAGARPAGAGEFTRRAFLNGKLTLDQAEAVADLIHAESTHAARAATRQLLGGMDRQLESIEQPLLQLLGHLEGALEFVEDDEVDLTSQAIEEILCESVKRISTLLALAPAGRLLRDGVQVVLAGPTNAGKSSLFNRIVEEDRAIVDRQAGTTRDVVSAAMENKGARFVFHDTAGLRAEAGRIEHKGINRTRQAVCDADIVLQVLSPDTQDDEFQLPPTEAHVIRIQTKADLETDGGKCLEGILSTSSLDGRGLPELWIALHAVVEKSQLQEAVSMGAVLNERHRHKLQQCLSELESLRDEIKNHQIGTEIVGTILASTLSQLGEISGRVFSEQLLENIFSRFCVGK